jgi:hypothetical protein
MSCTISKAPSITKFITAQSATKQSELDNRVDVPMERYGPATTVIGVRLPFSAFAWLLQWLRLGASNSEIRVRLAGRALSAGATLVVATLLIKARLWVQFPPAV